ncbi:hypothetical protein DOTSEDRAFT_69546 [Dothistroma septosporum NZE10]|uniref:Secreted protein n=1 Tax=Dothistroma septosporum (strain NZE10 / CBS 128990) TaxID=675120 RepID=N1PZL2_DOTSN|nr:hypothetical protein DOTSEDRAFT_69546 [Dothistroma septosporum NZE10]
MLYMRLYVLLLLPSSSILSGRFVRAILTAARRPVVSVKAVFRLGSRASRTCRSSRHELQRMPSNTARNGNTMARITGRPVKARQPGDHHGHIATSNLACLH